MSRQSAPPDVEDAARRRAEARAGRDWDTADRLRAEIEGAGWHVVDSGTEFRLEPANAPDVEVGGEIRYGRSEAVPSRLDEPATGLATVVVVASPDREATARTLDALLDTAPGGVDIVLVADGLPNAVVSGLLEGAGSRARESAPRAELVRTSEVLGQAAALNAGIRRAMAPVVVVLDVSIVPEGDVVTPLVEALADPTVAIAGPLGLRSTDLRHFDETTEADAVAIQGYLMAFRRADAAARGPLDEAFRFYRNLDIWWSLVVRDEGDGEPPRKALVVPGLRFRRGEPHAWTATPPAERDRLSKRNFYRILDRFRTRTDLAS
ncbi:MAG TPA: glycosyltransferase [Candidatus Limnocylindrales bacterium]|nr:glycosyltransferase [Candidatus Limnocylindrales bacterium]